MSLSGWCPPWRHDTDHAACQERLDRGLLARCDCAYHTPPTQPEDAA